MSSLFRPRPIAASAIVILFAGILPVLAATAQTHAFTGAHIIPIDGPEIPNGTLIIDGYVVSTEER